MTSPGIPGLQRSAETQGRAAQENVVPVWAEVDTVEGDARHKGKVAKNGLQLSIFEPKVSSAGPQNELDSPKFLRS